MLEAFVSLKRDLIVLTASNACQATLYDEMEAQTMMGQWWADPTLPWAAQMYINFNITSGLV